jgi:hypothetical protein
MEYTLMNPKHLIDALKLFKSIDAVTLTCKSDSLYLHSMVLWSIGSLEVELNAPHAIAANMSIQAEEFKLNLNVAETCAVLDQAAKTKANKWILTADKHAANLTLRAYDRQDRLLNETRVKTVELSNSLVSTGVDADHTTAEDGSYQGVNRFPIEFRNNVRIPLARLVQCMTTPTKANLCVTVDANNTLKFGTSTFLASSMQCISPDSETSTIGYARYSETFGTSIAKLLKSTASFMTALAANPKSSSNKNKRQRGSTGNISSRNKQKRPRLQVGLDDDDDDDEIAEDVQAECEVEDVDRENTATLLFDKSLPLCIDFTMPGARVTLFAGSKQKDDQSDDDADDDDAADDGALDSDADAQ